MAFVSRKHVILMTHPAMSFPGQSAACRLLIAGFQLDAARLEPRLSEGTCKDWVQVSRC